MKLRPYQEEDVAMFLRSPVPHRLLLGHEMGVGKTPSAIRAIDDGLNKKWLVICPANVRRNWRREIIKWQFGLSSIGLIEAGRERKIGKKATLERILAYQANIQVVSYDLIDQVNQLGWDGIILDEVHHLQSPGSKISKAIRTLIHLNMKAAVIALTGTPIPNEIKNIWNVLDTLWPSQWGRPGTKNRISWDFQQKHCLKERNIYGHVKFYGTRPGAAEELAERLRPFMRRVTRQEANAFLPQVSATPFYADAFARPLTIGETWAEKACDEPETTHVGVFTHLRSTAEALYEALIPLSVAEDGPQVICLHGGDSTVKRDQALQELKNAPRGILCATTHAFNEGVDLSFLQQAMVVEWTARPADLLQFIGRFGRHKETSTAVFYLIREGTDDEVKAEKVQAKLTAITEFMKEGHAETALKGIFTEKELTDEKFYFNLQRMVAEFDAESRPIFGGTGDEEIETEESDSNDYINDRAYEEGL